MPKPAKIYVYSVCALGAVLLAAAFRVPAWPTDPVRFAAYFVLSLIAAALKLRLPGLTSTMSIGFLMVRLGIVELSLPETLLLACAGVAVQCLWRTLQRPTAPQLAFNIAATVISVSLAFQVSQLLRSKWQTESVAVLITVVTCCYFASSSALVAGVLSLIQRKAFRTVWEHCYLLALPYYLLGGAIAGFMAASSRDIGWQLSLLMLPLMGLVFVFYNIRLTRPYAGSASAG